MENEAKELIEATGEVIEAVKDVPMEVLPTEQHFGVGDYAVAGLAGVGAISIIGGLVYGGIKLVKKIKAKKQREAVENIPVAEEIKDEEVIKEDEEE